MNWAEITPRQRDALVAEMMGWIRGIGNSGDPDYDEFTKLVNPDGEEIASEWGELRLEDFDALPAYTTDAATADAMEDELSQQGLEDIYLVKLAHICGFNSIVALGDATPDQRCLAALRAKGVEV